MTIEQRTVGEVVILTVGGSITMSGADSTRLADKVRSTLEQGQLRIVLDLAGVPYVDSSGLGELIAAYSAAKKRGGALKLLNVTKRLEDLLILTRLLTVFECFDTEPEAIASFEKATAPATATATSAGRG
jgi:anti-sigma B factor antagonist